MRNIALSIGLFIVLFMMSCQEGVKPKIVSEVFLNTPDGMNYTILNSIPSDKNTTIITLFNAADKSIGIYSVDSNNIVKTKRISSTFLSKCHYFQLFVKSPDSIYSLVQKTSFISILDSSGNPVKRLWLDTGSIVTAPINIVRLINQHIIIGNATHNHNVGIDSSRALYYKETKTISQIEFCSDSIARNTLYGKFPSSYTKDNLNFYNWFPSISETSSTEILVTYARDDSIYLYNNTKLIKSRLCKSKYIDEFIPLTEKQGFDRAYSISYQWHEPRYLDVIYNKYRDTYYRLVKHKDVLINENKVDMEQSTWSIIVMDSDLNVIHEYVLNRNEYSFMYAFPCAKGLYVKNATSKTDKRFKLTLLDI